MFCPLLTHVYITSWFWSALIVRTFNSIIAHIQQQPGRETRRARLSPFRIEESKLRWRARNIILTCFFFVRRVINLVSEESVVRQSLGVCHYKLILMNDNY